jgi:hypothetical protein
MTATAITPDRLKDALKRTGYDWLLRYWGRESGKHLEATAAALGAFVREYRRRFKERPDVLGLVEENPLKAAAFLQPDTQLASLEMKVMIWRILLGCEISKIQFRYQAGKSALLRVRLVTPWGSEETYTSQEASDFRVLRHIGITGAEGDYNLQGYYTLARPR